MAKQHTIKDLQDLINGWDKNEVIASYLNPEDVDVTEEPYEDALRQLMSDPTAIQELIDSGNNAFVKKYAKALLEDRKLFDPEKMTIENIVDAIKTVSGKDSFSKDDLLKQDESYLKMDGKTLKAIAKVNGWDFPEMLKLIEQEQTKQGRKDVYDESLVARTFFPRISESMRDKGDYDWQDVVLDTGENILQTIPLAGVGTKVATQGLRSGLKLWPRFKGFMIENATAPVTMAAADEIRKDDGSLLDFGINALTGTAINAAAGKTVGATIGALVPAGVAKRFQNWIDSGDDALKAKLEDIGKVLENPRNFSADEVKKATNELNLLTRQAEFTNKGLLDRSLLNLSGTVNIADYAANNRNAKNVGKLMRDIYEGEVLANKDKAWAKKVLKNEERYEPNSAYFTNRETLYPHMFINQKRVGSQAGLLKTPGRHNLDKPEFKIYDWNDLEPNNRTVNQLEDMFSGHHSKTFHYGVNIDDIIDGILKDPNMTKAIIRAYGGTNPREAVMSYVTNKLGRSDWLREKEAAGKRLFGEWWNSKDDKKKKKKED